MKKFNIQIKEAGVWETVDLTDTLEDAILLASSYVDTVREEWIRIIDPENKIL